MDRYAPLVMGVASRYRLRADDAADVSQGVWLKLVEHLDDIREPLALPGWIVTTTSREALRVLQSRQRTVEVDPQIGYRLHEATDDVGLDDECCAMSGTMRFERAFVNCVLSTATCWSCSWKILRCPTTTFSRRLGIPIGSIGPTRARSLEALAQYRSVEVVSC